MKLFLFAEVVTDATSKFRKIKASDYQSEGQYKIIDQGKDAVAGYTNDKTLINSDQLPIIIFGDHTRALKYEDTPIALGADGAKALKVDSKIANALYVYYYLRSINLIDAGYSRHFKFLKEIAIPIPIKDGAPNLDDQIRIAHLLGKVEGLIVQRKQHLRQLDDLLKSVFLEMFGDPVRNEKGWETSSFDEVVSHDCPLTYGIVQPGDEVAGGVPIVRPVDLKTDVIHLSGLKRIDPTIDNQFRRTRLKGGEILLCVRGTTGDLAVAGDDLLNANVTRGITPIWFEKNVSTKFMLNQLRSESLQRKISEKTYGVALKQINLADVRKLKVITPDIDIQNKFSNIADKIGGIKNRYQQSLTELETLYGALSQQAFKGELDLSRVPLHTMVKTGLHHD